jgi:hypothetical protein
MIDTDEKIKVAQNMEKWGGDFCKALAKLIYHADSINLVKIKTTWIDYWNRYLNWEKVDEK